MECNASNGECNAKVDEKGEQSSGKSSRLRVNAKYVILNFLQTTMPGDEEYTPTVLAETLKIPQGTVRGTLKRLKDEHKVTWRPRGSVHLYIAANRCSDDFKRLYNLHGAGTKYQIHGLTLKLEAEKIGKTEFTDYKSNCNEEGVGGVGTSAVASEAFESDGWNGKGGKGTGETHFQFSRKTLMIYCGCSNLPMDYDEFILWLKKCDGFLAGKRWPGLENQWREWVVVQYGLNQDHKVFRNDSPTRAVSLKGFEGWFARVYEKENRMLRDEIHSASLQEDAKSLEQFVHLASGGMTAVQIYQMIPKFILALNDTQKTNGDLVRAVGDMKRIFEADMKKQRKKTKELEKVQKEIKRRLHVNYL
jgi:hypothetical protein